VAIAPWVVSDDLWERIEQCYRRWSAASATQCRKQLPDRQALQGILFVLRMGIA
jgi:hypothetical protein